MHAFARCIHLWKATNKWDDTNTLTNLKDQKWTNEAKQLRQYNIISRQNFCLKTAEQTIYIYTTTGYIPSLAELEITNSN
jgi:hypothetical protein